MYEVIEHKPSYYPNRPTYVVVSNIEDVIQYFTEVGIADQESILFGARSKFNPNNEVDQWLEAYSRNGNIRLKLKPTRKAAIKRLQDVYSVDFVDWSGMIDNHSLCWLLQLNVKAV
jgi:hypothetical protein